MGVFADIIGVVGAIVILGLAVVGFMTLYAGRGPVSSDGEARVRAWLAEAQVADLGRRAQTAIFTEALRRQQSHGRHNGHDDLGRSTEQ